MRSVRSEREVRKASIYRGGGDQGRDRISVGSGTDFRRLGVGFPSARGRIPARAPVRGALGISSQLVAIN